MEISKTLVLLLISVVSLVGMISIRKSFSSASNVIVVPDDFESIQAAIDSADIGGKIIVKAGVYGECIVINMPLTIIGESGATIVGSSDHTVQITANNVNFSGFNIMGGHSSPWSGIYIFYSSGNLIQNNTIANHFYGIHLYDSSGNVLKNNKIIGNTYNLEVWGLFLQHFMHDIDSTNQVDQKPVYYWVNKHDKHVPSDAGYVAAVNCFNITVKDLTLRNNGAGVLFAYTVNSTILNNTILTNRRGVRLLSSDDDRIIRNNISNNGWCGLTIDCSKNSAILRNVISENGHYGIVVSFSSILPYFSEANVITENDISNNNYGLFFDSSFDNVICWNVFDNSYCNIILEDCKKNVFYGNLVEDSECGMRMQRSSDNSVYHNNFCNNLLQVDIKDFLSTNKWYDCYPSGGNYWSDYTVADFYDGPHQNVTGSDGIGDSPYVIDGNNRDNYPSVGMFSDFVICWEEEEYSLTVACNSTISNFRFEASQRMISFNVTGSDDTLGFCRITIPNVLIQDLWNNNYTVLVDGEKPLVMNNRTDNMYTYLFFAYMHSEHEVTIIPEFSLIIIPSLFLICTLFTVVFRKNVGKRRSWCFFSFYYFCLCVFLLRYLRF